MAQLSYPFDVIKEFAVASAIFGLYSAGVLEPFEHDIDHVLDPDAVAEQRGLSPRITRGLIEYLTRREYFESAGDGRFRLAPLGKELIAGKFLGNFVFMIGGYGKVLASAGELLTGKIEYGKDLRRNGHFVALGSQLQGQHPRYNSFSTVLETVRASMQPASILDIGCGSADFLIRLVKSCDAKAGIGIDLDHASCELARSNVASANLSSSIRILDGNACAPVEVDPSLEGSVDLVTAMFIIHEFFKPGSRRVIDALRGIARVLRPGTGRLLIMDKQTDVLDRGDAPPYFCEFKLVHDLTNQTLVDNATWKQTLHEAGLELTEEKILSPLSGTVQFVCRVAA